MNPTGTLNLISQRNNPAEERALFLLLQSKSYLFGLCFLKAWS